MTIPTTDDDPRDLWWSAADDLAAMTAEGLPPVPTVRTESTARAVADLLAAGYEPMEDYPGATAAHWKARCLACGDVRHVRLATVRAGRLGCPTCSWGGIYARALVYFMHHPELGAVKIGVGTDPGPRLGQLKSSGWATVRVWDDLPVTAAMTVERNVLAAWRSQGIPFGVTSDDMPAGGHTETAPAALVNVDDVAEIVARVLASPDTPMPTVPKILTPDQVAVAAKLQEVAQLHDDWKARRAEAREDLVAAVRGAIAAGVTEVDAARLGQVTRGTVRTWVGKDSPPRP